MKYYLHYVEGCSPKLKEFKTKAAYLKFFNKFRNKYELDNQDNFLEYCIKGEVECVFDDYYDKFLK